MLVASFSFALVSHVASFGPSGDVLVVDDDGGPGVDFAQIHEAVAAAADGDVVLVREGVYAAFVLAGKGLVILRDGPGIAKVSTPIVGELLEGQRVVLRGLTCAGKTRLVNNQGLVWIEECSFDHTLEILNSGKVVVARSHNDIAVKGPYGVLATSSDVLLQACTFRGGDGSDGVSLGFGVCTDGSIGGHGVYLAGGTLEVSGSALSGGDGGDGGGLKCGGGDGGHGAWIVNGALHHSTSTFAAGGGGGSTFGVAGGSGDAIHLDGSSALEVALVGLALETQSPVLQGTAVEVALDGPAGGLVFLVFGGGPAWIEAPALLHPALIAAPYTVIPLGPLDSAGSLDVAFPVGALPPGLASLTVFGQGLLITPLGGLLPAGVSVVTVIP